jgi:hypothetical protein
MKCQNTTPKIGGVNRRPDSSAVEFLGPAVRSGEEWLNETV